MGICKLKRGWGFGVALHCRKRIRRCQLHNIYYKHCAIERQKDLPGTEMGSVLTAGWGRTGGMAGPGGALNKNSTTLSWPAPSYIYARAHKH